MIHFLLIKKGELAHTTSQKKCATMELQGWKLVQTLKAWNASFREPVNASNS